MLIRLLRTRPRLAVALAVGVACGMLAPRGLPGVTRSLVGWNAGVWLYLALDAAMMARADHHDLRRTAKASAESAGTVLAAVVGAAFASLAAIVLELARRDDAGPAWAQAVLTLATVVGSWLLVAMLFTLSYASLYYRDAEGDAPGRGLDFPGGVGDAHGDEDDDERGRQPDYVDFLYFAFTIAVASQTSDVAVTTRSMRKLVLWHSVLAFVFNTTLLALTVNIAAGLF